MASAGDIDPHWLAAQIDGTRAQDIRAAVTQLIRDGALAPGSQLPTIRQLADALGTKVSAVTDAWTLLRRDGLLDTRRRGGTRVAGGAALEPGDAHPLAGWAASDLANAWPDVALLPDVAPVFADAVDPARAFVPFTGLDATVTAALSRSWPFAAEAFTAVPGGTAALRLTLAAALEGTNSEPVVAIEAPGLVRTMAVLRDLGVTTIALDGDADGVSAASLTSALAAGASIVMLQPRGRIPTGSRLTDSRADELAAILADTGALIIEEDANGPLFEGASIGARLPSTTVRITQYWRAYGPDVDLVTIGGAAQVVDRVRNQQRRTGQRVSTLLQQVVARLATDPGVDAVVRSAGERYQRRHDAFAKALSGYGVQVESRGGLFAWIPAPDATVALALLSSYGLRALSGDGCFPAPPPRGYLRVSVTRLPDDPVYLGQLAAIVANAVAGASVPDTE